MPPYLHFTHDQLTRQAMLSELLRHVRYQETPTLALSRRVPSLPTSDRISRIDFGNVKAGAGPTAE